MPHQQTIGAPQRRARPVQAPSPGEHRVCARCIYDTRIQGIHFDDDGVCQYCRQTEELKARYGTGTAEGRRRLDASLSEIRAAGRGRRYDCVVGVSGGTDSSFLVAKAVEWGLRPLAVHYDNTWNSAIATENIRKVLGALDVNLYTYVIDNREADDLFRSFFLAGVLDLDASTDLALAEIMYRAASENGVGYVLEGHSFVAEGVAPLSYGYFDGRLIESIHRRFGRLPMRTYPNMKFWTFMKWVLLKRIRKVRPLWYLDYSKQEAREFLEREFGWEYYGGHHLENRLSEFSHKYYLPRKFGIDQRNNSLSAAVRAGRMAREDALREYATPPTLAPEMLAYTRKRFGMTEGEFEDVMRQPPHRSSEYPTYKPTFERLRPLFRVLAERDLVPMSFYLKYCTPAERAQPAAAAR